MFYHGTHIEGIKYILNQQKVQAHKSLPHHAHEYASFSNQLEYAHEFGRIILVFNESIKEQLIPVLENNLDWSLSNVELMEYIVGMEQSVEEIEKSTEGLPFDKEHYWELVSIGDLNFMPDQVEVWVTGSDVQQSKDVYQVLKQEYGEKFSIELKTDVTREFMAKDAELFQVPYGNGEVYRIEEKKGRVQIEEKIV